MAILITGGAGYIGSHTMVEFLNAGRELVVVDNFMNSKPEALERVKKITGKDFKFFQVDLLDKEAIDKVVRENNIDSCIHFAGLKAVGESCAKPMLYYHNNITGTLNLCEALHVLTQTKKIITAVCLVLQDMTISLVKKYSSTKPT